TGGAFQGNLVFRAEKYPVDFPGFEGRDLSTGVQLESNPIISGCVVGVDDFVTDEIHMYPNPTSDLVTIEGIVGAQVSVYNGAGSLVRTFSSTSSKELIDLGNETPGMYAVVIEYGGATRVRKLIVN
ncbi:MAG: T9SS type A sorting domain-containing protein, partial [Bacteroidetes bacterium]